MNMRSLMDASRQNWYLVLALVVCVAAVAVKLAMDSDAGPPVPSPSATGQPFSATGPVDSLGALQKATKSEQEKATEAIRMHQAVIERNPESEEAPARLVAMGNLYRQKMGDYAEAARCYELLLYKYPESPNVRNACINLADCYERMGEPEKAKSVYERMMRLFPEDSQEYKYAQSVLRGATNPRE